MQRKGAKIRALVFTLFETPGRVEGASTPWLKTAVAMNLFVSAAPASALGRTSVARGSRPASQRARQPAPAPAPAPAAAGAVASPAAEAARRGSLLDGQSEHIGSMLSASKAKAAIEEEDSDDDWD